MSELEDRIWKLQGTQHVFTTIGQTEGGRTVKGEGDVTRATIYVRMTELEERDYTQFAVQQQARKMMVDYPDLRVSVNDVSAFQGGRRSRWLTSAGPARSNGWAASASSPCWATPKASPWARPSPARRRLCKG